MQPAISPVQHRGQVLDQNEGGSFFSKIPIWAWIAGGVVVLYVLYTKLGTNSTSNPAVNTTTDPNAGNTQLSDLLAQLLANQQAIQDWINNHGGGSGGGGGGGSQNPRDNVNPSPPNPTGGRDTNPAPSNPTDTTRTAVTVFGTSPTAPPINGSEALMVAASRNVSSAPTNPRRR